MYPGFSIKKAAPANRGSLLSIIKKILISWVLFQCTTTPIYLCLRNREISIFVFKYKISVETQKLTFKFTTTSQYVLPASPPHQTEAPMTFQCQFQSPLHPDRIHGSRFA